MIYFFKRKVFITLYFCFIFNVFLIFPKTLVVGIYQNEPKIFWDENLSPKGFFVDIIEYIAKKEGWQIDYELGTWNEGLINLDQGKIDIMVDVAYTEERSKRWNFNKEPVLSDWFQVYTGKKSKVESVVDLAGKKVAVLDQSVQYDAFNSYMENFGFYCDIAALPDYKKSFQMLVSGEVDACITNRFYGIAYIKDPNIKETGIIFHPTRLHYAFPKDSDEAVINAIDRGLNEIKKNVNSIYYRSMEKWFTEKPDYKLPILFKEIIIGLIFSVLLFAGIIFIMRFKIKSRTKQLVALNKKLELEIIERKKSEKKLQEHHDLLEELVMERTIKLEESNKELESFSFSVSHDLQAPLRAIQGFSNILLDDCFDKLDEKSKKFLGNISKSADKMKQLINGLLEFSRTGRKDIIKTYIDVKPLITEIYKDLIRENQNRDIDFTIKEIINFSGDKTMIQQVFVNLISNALKFTKNNEKTFIEIGSSYDNNNITYYIKDNGVGFDEEYKDKLFRVFQRLHSATDFEGTGIGLALVQRIISKHDGRVWAEAKINKGAAFYFSIPK